MCLRGLKTYRKHGRTNTSKEIHSFNKATILKDINKERICKIEGHLSSLKTEKLLVNQLTDNVIKKFITIISIISNIHTKDVLIQ